VFDARHERGAAPLLAEIRRVASGETDGPLWIVTQNAQSIGTYAVPDPDAAALWGLGRTFALEHPDQWGGLIDLEADTDEEEAERQIGLAIADPSEDQVAFRSGVRLRPRLVSVAAPSAAPIDLIGGSYLVTGGLGGLGLQVARWLAESGAARVVLVGRVADPALWSADDPRHASLSALRETGAEVVLRSVDLTDRDAVAKLFAELQTAEVPLRGIIHAAAVFDQAPLAELTVAQYERLLAPKTLGAQHLAEAARDCPLDFFVMFSSTTALLGVAELGHYAAANLFLDAYAARLRSEGVPALSINWGLWQEMRLADASDATRYAQSGLRTMDSATALEALGRAIATGASNAIIASVDWERLRNVYEGRRQKPLLAELGGAEDEKEAEHAPLASSALLDEIADLPTESRQERITSAVEDELRAVLRLTTGSLDNERGFFELGMDSLMSVELKTRLEKRFGARLPATLTFNYPTVAAVAEYLRGRVDAAAADRAAERPAAELALVVEVYSADTAAADQIQDSDDATEESLAAMLEDRLARLGLGDES
jgi:myxalamid-type polyketide synthase MxaE and MxaD